MNLVPRPFKIGLLVGLAVIAGLLAAASALFVSEEWFGTLVIVGGCAGSLTGAHLVHREFQAKQR